VKTRKQPRVIFLVACVKSKRRGPLPARELYRSVWFTKARDYVEHLEQPWAILSAKHHLLSPRKVIRSYNKTLNKMTLEARRMWSDTVVREMRVKYKTGSIVVILAGKKYREHVVPQLKSAGFLVKAPLARKGIGRQLSWFNKMLGFLSLR
jgi:hypothetical protein